jgi:hypothetical protein
MRSPPELRRNPLASRDSGGHQAKQGEEVNRHSGAIRVKDVDRRCCGARIGTCGKRTEGRRQLLPLCHDSPTVDNPAVALAGPAPSRLFGRSAAQGQIFLLPLCIERHPCNPHCVSPTECAP